jgi:ComF family protein
MLFPPKCLCCGRLGDEVLCGDCSRKIEYVDSGGRSTVRSVCKYEGVVKRAIQKFKFRGKKALSAPLASLLIEYIRRDNSINCGEIHLITSVPLSQRRFKKRGFNQSSILAEQVAGHFGIPFEENVLLRTRDTSPQFDLRRSDRIKNVEGAFLLTDEELVRGRTILIIDDILTTGATASECSRVLLGGGAEKVLVLTLSQADD